MFRTILSRLFAFAVIAFVIAGATLAADVAAPTKFSGLGEHRRKVSIKSAEAQEFFNQGFNLSYGFNHAEAMRAFREVARLDPNCAIAYWGQALVLGPNINMPTPPEAEPVSGTPAARAKEHTVRLATLVRRVRAIRQMMVAGAGRRVSGPPGGRAPEYPPEPATGQCLASAIPLRALVCVVAEQKAA